MHLLVIAFFSLLYVIQITSLIAFLKYKTHLLHWYYDSFVTVSISRDFVNNGHINETAYNVLLNQIFVRK